jgi:hypothetical protein
VYTCWGLAQSFGVLVAFSLIYGFFGAGYTALWVRHTTVKFLVALQERMLILLPGPHGHSNQQRPHRRLRSLWPSQLR